MFLLGNKGKLIYYFSTINRPNKTFQPPLLKEGYFKDFSGCWAKCYVLLIFLALKNFLISSSFTSLMVNLSGIKYLNENRLCRRATCQGLDSHDQLFLND
jgi:hypothetical protein